MQAFLSNLPQHTVDALVKQAMLSSPSPAAKDVINTFAELMVMELNAQLVRKLSSRAIIDRLEAARQLEQQEPRNWFKGAWLKEWPGLIG